MKIEALNGRGRSQRTSCVDRTPVRALERLPLPKSTRYEKGVAPFAGAWIETSARAGLWLCRSCRPLRGGVDRNLSRSADGINWSASPPSRGRGSKRPGAAHVGGHAESPPSRGRGSKLRRRFRGGLRPEVAPFAGAWIETRSRRATRSTRPCRPLRGGVDRNLVALTSATTTACRPLRGGVDRNVSMPDGWVGSSGRPLRGGVDRNSPRSADAIRARTSPPSRGRGSKRSGRDRQR